MQSSLVQKIQHGTVVRGACACCTHSGTWEIWEGHCAPAGTFRLTLDFSEEYPNKAPVVKFKSTMFHPNSTCLLQPQLLHIAQNLA